MLYLNLLMPLQNYKDKDKTLKVTYKQKDCLKNKITTEYTGHIN